MDSQQQQRQQNQEGYAASQAYDHQSYYNNYYYYPQQNHDPFQQYPSHYNTDYANSQQNPAQQEITHKPSSVPPPPGVYSAPHTVGNDGGTMMSAEVPGQSQQNDYCILGGWNQTSVADSVAAAAAVLAEVARTVGEGGFQGQVWNQARFRTGSMRPPGGGGSFQGRGRGNFRNHTYGRGRSGSSFRGRGGRGYGRSRGGSRSMQINGATSSPQKPSDTEQPESIEKEAGSSADCHEEEVKDQMLPQTTAPYETNATTTSQQSSRAARCELCKIGCTSLEILEQHYNGKRHKKNLQKMGTMRFANEAVLNSAQAPIGDLNTDETLKPEKLVQGEGNKILTENSTLEAVGHENQLAFETHSDEAEQPGPSAELQHDAHEKEPGMNLSGNQRQRPKRKMQHGHGGKHMKQEPRTPKVVIPLICDLCNVECDTQEVFNRHLAGKKHIAKLKRFEGHQATFGSTGVQALYPPNPITQILLNQGSQQGVHLQHSPYPAPAAYAPPQASHSAPVASCAVPGIQQNLNI